MNPEPELFDCPRRSTLRLTASACAGMWRQAKRMASGSLSPVAKCKGCPIGAGHAGEPVGESRAVDQLDRRCARCHRPASKLVYGTICVSCANRQYEYLKGRNRRGNRPKMERPPRKYAALVFSRAPEPREIPLACTGAEAMLSMLRRSTCEAFIAFDGRKTLIVP